jgi:hypothetical protein
MPQEVVSLRIDRTDGEDEGSPVGVLSLGMSNRSLTAQHGPPIRVPTARRVVADMVISHRPLVAATSTVGDWAYTFYNTPLSWSDAEAACVTAGGHLASFTSQTTYETVMNTFYGYITPPVDGTTTVEDVGVSTQPVILAT